MLFRSTTYDGYGLKARTMLGPVVLKFKLKAEEIESDDTTMTFVPMAQTTASIGGLPGTPTATRESAADREVLTLGVEGSYRLARGALVRLGYELEQIDRDDHHFGETDTHEVKASLKMRPSRKTRVRASYMYQQIDNPFQNPDAAEYVDPITGLTYYDKGTDTGYTIGSGPTYGTDYYDLRATDLSNLPENVHEAKVSASWSPKANFSTTFTFRARNEENELDRSTWKQDSLAPGLSFWYAPTQKLNLTFLYNYLGQRTESKFCQGWYDG